MGAGNDTKLKSNNSPKHVAIIMDGNGRWAEKRGLPRQEGHRKGVDAVRHLVEELKETDLKILTLYAFSTENWQRPKDEVSFLMGMLKRYISKDLEKLHKENVRILFVGSVEGLSPDLADLIAKAQETTKNNNAMTLQITFNYGSWDEITEMVKGVVAKAQAGSLTSADVTQELIRSHLMTANISDPDIVIRTSGEYRMSNFMLLQSAYSELVFQSVLWPDYTIQDYQQALAEYETRDRRFGKTSETETSLAPETGLEAAK